MTKSEKNIAKALNVTSYPALRVLPAGGSSLTSEVVHFTGKVSFFAIDLFLMDYAKPASSSKQQQGGKTAKGKDAPEDSKNKFKTEKASKVKTEKASDAKSAPSGQTDSSRPTKDAKSAPGKADTKRRSKEPEPPVYGDSAKKEPRERRGGEL